jgi:AraC-like DNA-binding protein
MYDHTRLFDRLLQACTSDPAASLRSLSRRLGVHPQTLTQVVRARTGTPFSIWRTYRRTASACHLLRTRPELSVKQIAAEAGFNTTSVFDRFLRRTCGRSPSECRRAAVAGGGSCADGRAPIRRATDRHERKVNVFTRASTIDGIQPSGTDVTLEVVRRGIPTETSRSPT